MEKKKEMNIVLAIVICLAVLGVLIFISINKKVNMDNDNLTGEQTGVNENVQMAKAGDMVAMNYTGRLTDGTVFDSNVDPKFQHVEPFVFPLGAGRVIAGWDKGIVGMKVGEKKTLTISPEDAYGSQEIKDPSGKVIIPANSTLTFEVELLAINNNQ